MSDWSSMSTRSGGLCAPIPQPLDRRSVVRLGRQSRLPSASRLARTPCGRERRVGDRRRAKFRSARRRRRQAETRPFRLCREPPDRSRGLRAAERHVLHLVDELRRFARLARFAADRRRHCSTSRPFASNVPQNTTLRAVCVMSTKPPGPDQTSPDHRDVDVARSVHLAHPEKRHVDAASGIEIELIVGSDDRIRIPRRTEHGPVQHLAIMDALLNGSPVVGSTRRGRKRGNPAGYAKAEIH